MVYQISDPWMTRAQMRVESDCSTRLPSMVGMPAPTPGDFRSLSSKQSKFWLREEICLLRNLSEEKPLTLKIRHSLATCGFELDKSNWILMCVNVSSRLERMLGALLHRLWRLFLQRTIDRQAEGFHTFR